MRERARTILQKSFSEIYKNADLKRELISVWSAFSGKSINKNCQDCYQDAYIELRYFVTKNITPMQERDYILKNKPDGTARLIIEYRGTHYTNANLTDEKAIEILKAAPANIKNFEKFPQSAFKEIPGIEVYVDEQIEFEEVDENNGGSNDDDDATYLKSLQDEAKNLGISFRENFKIETLERKIKEVLAKNE